MIQRRHRHCRRYDCFIHSYCQRSGNRCGINFEDAKKETSEVLKELAEKSVTLIRDRENIIPLNPEKIKKVTIITYAHYPLADDLGALKSAFEKRGAEVVLRGKLESFNDIKEVSESSDLIVYAAYIGFHKPKGGPYFVEDVFWSLRYVGVEGNEKSVGLSLGYPFIHYDYMPDVPLFANLYVTSDESQNAFVAALYGEIPFKGVSPLNIELGSRSPQ